MTELEKSLYVAWIGRFGKKKVAELTEGYDGARSSDRIRGLIKASSTDQLSALLLEGFAGFFHQTAFIAKLKTPSLDVAALSGAKPVPGDGVKLQHFDVDATGDYGRFLFMVTKRMDFVSGNGGAVVSQDVPFPVTLGIAGKILIVQVLTMQSGLSAWGRIIGQEFRRMLTFVRADFFHEKVLKFLVTSGGETPAYHDYSKRSIELMKSDRVD